MFGKQAAGEKVGEHVASNLDLDTAIPELGEQFGNS